MIKMNPKIKARMESLIKKLDMECKPPCDSYGICDNCGEAILVRIGFKAGLTACYDEYVVKLIERLEDAEAKLKNAHDCINGKNSLSDTDFIDDYFKKWGV